MQNIYENITAKEDLFVQNLTSAHNIHCVAYGAEHHIDGYDAEKNKQWKINTHKIKNDLKILRKHTSCLRIYTIDQGGKEAVKIAHDLNFDTIYLGIEIWKDQQKNIESMDETIRIAHKYPLVKAILLGNELFHHNAAKMMKMSEAKYKELFAYVRERTKLPIAVSEPISYPMEYFHFSDFISVHAHLYWFQMEPEQVDYFFDKYLARFKKAYPDKKIIISEIGWPKNGITYGKAVPSAENQKLLLTNALSYFEKHDIDYILFEAFDQPWKQNLFEGRAGAHWGIFNEYSVAANSKTLYISLYTVISIMLLALFSRRKIKNSFISNVLTGAFPHIITFSYIHIILTLQKAYEIELSFSSCVFLFFTFLTFTTVIYRMYMLLEIYGEAPYDITTLKNENAAHINNSIKNQPFVSIHVPCKDEDPEVVIECIKSLQAIDYSNYEIIVLDNNTTDKNLYEPIEKYAASQGALVRFYHQENVKGFKAGALNICLEKANAKTSIIAVVDSDYIVSEAWLKDVTKYFDDDKVSCVQCPQDFETQGGTLLQKLLYNEYIGFFKIGMVQRAFRNAIIHHGTMICIRKTALEALGGWPTSTIVEDADLGLSLQEEGKKTVYVPESYGKGSIPFTHSEYCKQRFRWALGAYQLMSKHKAQLFWFNSGLSLSQRVHYILGYLPWLLTAMHPVFLLIVLFQVISAYKNINSLVHPMFFVPFILFITSEITYAVLSYAKRVDIKFSNVLLSILTGASLTFTISKSFWMFVLRKTVMFEPTKKTQSNKTKSESLISMHNFFNLAAILTFCLTALLCFNLGAQHPELYIWLLVTLLFSVPTIGHIAMTILSKNTKN